MIEKEDFLRFCVVKKNFAPRTVEEGWIRTRTIERFIDNRPYTNALVEEFLYSIRQKGVKTSAINNYITALKRIKEYFEDRGVPCEDFLKGIGYGKEERAEIEILTPKEIISILSVDVSYPARHLGKDTSGMNELYKTFTMFLAFTGCRFSEAALLKVKYFDSEGWVKFVETKTKVNRRVGITNPLLDRLQQLVANKTPEEYVFCTGKGNPVVSTFYLYDLKERVKLAGITKRVYPHLFRHSFITTLIMNNVPISLVAGIVGHADINTTNYYTHLADDSLKKALYRHPLIRENVSPHEILKNIIETIKGFRLDEDKRITYKLSETSTSLTLDLTLA